MVDVGDMVAYNKYCRDEAKTTIFALGGLIGEIIQVLATIDDFYQSQPSTIGNKLTFEQVEGFIIALLEKGELGDIILAVGQDWNFIVDEDGQQIPISETQQLYCIKENLLQPGLKYLINFHAEVCIADYIIDLVLGSILKLHKEKDRGFDEGSHKGRILSKVHAFVSTPDLYDLRCFECYVKLRNYRDVVPESQESPDYTPPEEADEEKEIVALKYAATIPSSLFREGSKD